MQEHTESSEQHTELPGKPGNLCLTTDSCRSGSRASSWHMTLRCICCSANANLELKKKLGSAERILKLGELCRKLETEQEKVLPFCSPEQALGLQPLSEQEEAPPAEHRHAETDSSHASFEDSDTQVGVVVCMCKCTAAGCNRKMP